MVHEGAVTGSYRAAVACAVATTTAFIASPSPVQFQIAARSLEEALSQGLFLLGVPKGDVAKLASYIAANCGSEVPSPKLLRMEPLPSPMQRGFNSPAPREPDIVTQSRIEYALDSCGDRLTNLPRHIGVPDRQGK